MTAAIAAAAIGAGTSIIGGITGSKSAKKAAETQSKAATQAAERDAAAVAQANEIARVQFEADQARQTSSLSSAQNRLNPYSSVGANALSQLGELTSAGHGYIPAQAASGTTQANREQITKWRQIANQAVQDNSRFIEEAKARQDWTGVQRLEAQAASLQQAADQSNAAFASMQDYKPGSAAQEANDPRGGELYQSFTGNDYLNDPTSGAFYDPKAFETGTYTGGTQGIKDWLAQNPNATDSDIAAAMKQYGVSSAQMAEATGLGINEINQRLAKSRDYSVTAPNLNANFDEAKWFQQQGANQEDLTKNFDESKWFQEQGVDPKALTQNFDTAGFLAKGGKTEADLLKDFDRSKFLGNAGFSEADLARKFTANDFQVDPGYNFRMQEGNKGIENSAAARGGQLSGATMKALAKYNSDLGSQEYGNAFNRFQNTQVQAGNALNNAEGSFNNNRANTSNQLNDAYSRFGSDRANLQGQFGDAYNRFGANRENLSNQFGNAFNRFGSNRENARTTYNQSYDRFNNDRTTKFNRLAALAGIGQQSATQQGGWDMNYAGNMSNAGANYANQVGQNSIQGGARQNEYMTDAASARSAGTIGQSNAFNSAINGVGNSLNSYAYLRQPTSSSSNSDFFNTNKLYNSIFK